MLSEALPAQSWDLVDWRVDGPKSPGPGSLGPAWVLLCTVDSDTSHCGLFPFLTNERYVAERPFRSQGALTGERRLTYVRRKVCCTRVSESVRFKLLEEKKQPAPLTEKWSLENRTENDIQYIKYVHNIG